MVDVGSDGLEYAGDFGVQFTERIHDAGFLSAVRGSLPGVDGAADVPADKAGVLEGAFGVFIHPLPALGLVFGLWRLRRRHFRIAKGSEAEAAVAVNYRKIGYLGDSILDVLLVTIFTVKLEEDSVDVIFGAVDGELQLIDLAHVAVELVAKEEVVDGSESG